MTTKPCMVCKMPIRRRNPSMMGMEYADSAIHFFCLEQMSSHISKALAAPRQVFEDGTIPFLSPPSLAESMEKTLVEHKSGGNPHFSFALISGWIEQVKRIEADRSRIYGWMMNFHLEIAGASIGLDSMARRMKAEARDFLTETQSETTDL